MERVNVEENVSVSGAQKIDMKAKIANKIPNAETVKKSIHHYLKAVPFTKRKKTF